MEDSPNAARGNYAPEEIRQARAAYFAAITFVDEQIGRVLDALEQRGELENTLILFTADHGDMMGDQHLWRKTYPYEPSARVPMILRWPEALDVRGAQRGMVSNHLVELRDVFPTFLDGAGVDKPAALEGSSLLDVVRGNTSSWRATLDLEHGQGYWDNMGWVALTDGREKYIYFTRDGAQQLFNLDVDPHELHDLAPDPAHAKSVAAWRTRMAEHLAARGEPWVRDGNLGTFPDVIRYAPHHPTM